MEVNPSENQFFSNKDTFLNMTIFLSMKAIYRMRCVSRLFNLWLSDLQNNIAWKKKIQLMFPDSYEEILQNPFGDQMQRVLKYDSFVDEGHFVSYFSDPLRCERNCYQIVYQIPWLTDTFLIALEEVIYLYNAVSASILANLKLQFSNYDVLLNIKDHKIGFLEPDDNILIVYRLENGSFIHERTETSPDFINLLRQIYGDYVIEREDFATEVSYSFRSISKNELAKKISFPASECFEELSALDPVIYICYQDTNYANYFICELNCITQCERQLYSSKLKVCVSDGDQGIQSIKLTENAHGKYLKIYQCGYKDYYVEIFDLTHHKVIYSGKFYDEFDQQAREFWSSLTYNPGTPYFSVADHVLTVQKFDLANTNVSHKDAKVEMYYTYDQPRDFLGSHSISKMRWLNEDILTFKYSKDSFRLASFKKPMIRQVFFSIKRCNVIGQIEEDVKDVFVDGDNVFCFARTDEIYHIQLDMSYVEAKTKKRKLLEVADEDTQIAKKAKN